MVVHIVMFKFKDENKEDNIKLVKKRLEELEEKIEILKSIEVGVDFSKSERSFDLSLYSTFASKDDLKSYAVDEEHLRVLSLIKSVTLESKVVDYFL